MDVERVAQGLVNRKHCVLTLVAAAVSVYSKTKCSQGQGPLSRLCRRLSSPEVGSETELASRTFLKEWPSDQGLWTRGQRCKTGQREAQQRGPMASAGNRTALQSL